MRLKLVGLTFLVGCAYPALADPAWDHICEQLRAVAETYKKWGITFDLQADKTFQGKAGRLPSYVKTTAQLESRDQLNDTLHLNMEAGLGLATARNGLAGRRSLERGAGRLSQSDPTGRQPDPSHPAPHRRMQQASALASWA